MTDKKMKIAITGGIGSGKSVVSQIIRDLGYEVFSSDDIYGELLENEEVVKKIYDVLSLEKKYDNKKLVFDRKAVAETVFFDRAKLDALNGFTHALVYARIEEIYKNQSENKPVFFEIPLLFESEKEGEFDKVFVIVRELADRIEAVKIRSGLSVEEIKARISNQIDYDNYDFNGHTLIVNDSSPEELKKRVKVAVENL